MIVDADAIKPIIVLFGTGSGDAELGSEAAVIPIASGEVGLGTDGEYAGLKIGQVTPGTDFVLHE